MKKTKNIEQLIHDLCPSGIEYKMLGEIATRNKGTNITAGQMKAIAKSKGDVRVFAAGNTVVDVNAKDLPQANIIREPGIIVKSRGYVSFEYYDAPFTHKNEMWSYSNFVNANIKYVFYYLEQHTAYFQAIAKANSVKLPQICVADTDTYKIALPPLAIQEEIVRILDTIERLIDNINTEIKTRQRQLEIFKEVKLGAIKDKCKTWYKLGDICYMPKERIKASELTADNYVGVDNMLQNKQGVTPSRYVPNSNAIKYIEGDVLIGNIRPNLRKIWLADRVGGTNGDVVTLRRLEKYEKTILPKYLFYILSDEAFFIYDVQYARGAKMPRGNKEMIMEYSIPLPPIKEQQAIAAKLDTIEAFIANLNEERTLRQHQYEYYRAKLISLLK